MAVVLCSVQADVVGLQLGSGNGDVDVAGGVTHQLSSCLQNPFVFCNFL